MKTQRRAGPRIPLLSLSLLSVVVSQTRGTLGTWDKDGVKTSSKHGFLLLRPRSSSSSSFFWSFPFRLSTVAVYARLPAWKGTFSVNVPHIGIGFLGRDFFFYDSCFFFQCSLYNRSCDDGSERDPRRKTDPVLLSRAVPSSHHVPWPRVRSMNWFFLRFLKLVGVVSVDPICRNLKQNVWWRGLRHAVGGYMLQKWIHQAESKSLPTTTKDRKVLFFVPDLFHFPFLKSQEPINKSASHTIGCTKKFKIFDRTKNMNQK